jgi:putative tricarboxylic transport membrane protein
MKNAKLYVCTAVLTPAVILVVLLIYGIMALQLSPPMLAHQAQESFFPLVIAVVGLPIAAGLLYDGIKERRKTIAAMTAEERCVKTDYKKFKKPFIIGLLTLLFIIGFAPLGYFIASPLYIFFFMLIYDDKPQQIIRKIIYTILICAFVYALYTYLFAIQFPVFMGR